MRGRIDSTNARSYVSDKRRNSASRDFLETSHRDPNRQRELFILPNHVIPKGQESRLSSVSHDNFHKQELAYVKERLGGLGAVLSGTTEHSNGQMTPKGPDGKATHVRGHERVCVYHRRFHKEN